MALPGQQQKNNDPYLSFRFLIEIKGVVEAGFTECSGLQVETEFEEYREGGVNEFVHRLPKMTKYQTITLKRGITDSDSLWKWHQDVVKGKFKRQNGSILLMDVSGEEKLRWNFENAYPVKWAGPELKAEQGTIAIETLELVHHGLTKAGKNF